VSIFFRFIRKMPRTSDFIPVVATCNDQCQNIKITLWASHLDVVDLLEPLFGTITRLQGRHDKSDWQDVKDGWADFISFWDEAPEDLELPTMYLQATVERHELVDGTATASDAAIILDQAFNRDQGRRHDAGPFPWTQHELVGRGAKGLVYKGRKDDGEWVAVKAFDISTPRLLETCELEVTLLSKLDHPNIVKMLAHYRQPGAQMMYIVLEYMGGGSLRSVLDLNKKGLPAATVQDYTRQIVRGVAHLHSLCILHRDVKAANVLMSEDGVLKLCDFDVSKELPWDRRSGACLTVIGSSYWMAPELCCGDAPYGLKVDVWAVGCVLIEMLTGGLPWQTFLCLEAAVTIIGETQGPPPHLPKDLPEPLNDFALRCLEVNPAKRASAADLLLHPYLV
jgi:serine/threonine protein kinase